MLSRYDNVTLLYILVLIEGLAEDEATVTCNVVKHAMSKIIDWESTS